MHGETSMPCLGAYMSKKIQNTILFNPSHIIQAWTGCPALELRTTGIWYLTMLRNRRAHWGAKLVRFSLRGLCDWQELLMGLFVISCLFLMAVSIYLQSFSASHVFWCAWKASHKCVCLCSLDHSSSSCIRVRTQSQYFIQSESAVISALVCTDWLELRKRSRKSSHTLVWFHQSQQPDLEIMYTTTDCWLSFLLVIKFEFLTSKNLVHSCPSYFKLEM